MAPDAAVVAAPLAGELGARAARRRGRLNGTLLAGLVLLAAIVAIAVLGPVLLPTKPDAFGLPLQPPSLAHPFGTDNFGRDVLTRVVYAAHLDLLIGIVPTSITLVTGVILGSIAGYYGGKIDTVIMRVADVVMAFPFIVLVIGIIAMLGPGLRNLFIAIALVGWISYARLVRGEILVVKHQDYVVAAEALGNTSRAVLLRHVLPNVIGQTIVYAMSDAVLNILLGAALSFLGLGVQPPTPSWGNMLYNAQSYFFNAPWITLYPGAMILATVLCINFIGDGLRDALDPRMRDW